MTCCRVTSYNTHLALLSHRDVPAHALPVAVRTRVDRRVVLLRPVRLRLVAQHLLVLFLQLVQRLVLELQARVGSVDLEHDVLLALAFRQFLLRSEVGLGRGGFDFHRQDRRVLTVAGLLGDVEAFPFAAQIGPPENAM